MTRPEIEAALVRAIDTASATGFQWWPGSEMAPIAYRRWSSFARRSKTKCPTTEDRTLDLAKGLQTHFEPGIPYTPLSEWLLLARVLAAVFVGVDG